MVISLYEGGKMNSVENYAIRYLEPKDVKDLDQYNALLRYTFQVTEDELTATGWKMKRLNSRSSRYWSVRMCLDVLTGIP